MKKRWTILLCTLLLCALCACGGQASQTEDVPAPEDELGKPIGSGQAAGKRTVVDLLGLDACAGLVARETALACEALSGLADSGFLLELADSLADRRH